MSAHTRGPWHIHVNAADDIEINDAEGRTVTKWYYGQNCISQGDPSLVAAAPELLQMLELFDTPTDVGLDERIEDRCLISRGSPMHLRILALIKRVRDEP